VAIGRAIEDELKAQAKLRQGARNDLNPNIPQNFVECKESAEIAAQQAGFGNKETYRFTL
jgi:hypothetical protein